MTKEMIENHVRNLIAEEIGDNVESIKTTSRLKDDLDFDSFDRMEVALLVEEEFGVELADDRIASWQTVADVVEHVTQIVGAAA